MCVKKCKQQETLIKFSLFRLLIRSPRAKNLVKGWFWVHSFGLFETHTTSFKPIFRKLSSVVKELNVNQFTDGVKNVIKIMRNVKSLIIIMITCFCCCIIKFWLNFSFFCYYFSFILKNSNKYFKNTHPSSELWIDCSLFHFNWFGFPILSIKISLPATNNNTWTRFPGKEVTITHKWLPHAMKNEHSRKKVHINKCSYGSRNTNISPSIVINKKN